MSRLIVVSNRVADISSAAQAGGLAVAVGDALRDGNGLWFGWNGEIVNDTTQIGLNLERQSGITIATQALTQEEFDGFYLGYSNRALWPVFHNRLDLAEFDSDYLETYRAVNRRFAQSLAALIDPGDIVWIHDYQLIPLAAELRELGITNRMGFFLHIPFPPPEIISAVPGHDKLLDTLFAYDVVGFQTDLFLANFERYVEQTESAVSDITPFRAERRRPLARAYPIGIDVDSFIAMTRTPEAEDRIRRLNRGTKRSYMVGVDRLDYSKGLPDRFRAYKRFLENHEEHRKNTVLIQIAAPTREQLTAYADIRTELERLTGAINGAFGDFDWTPVRYIHRQVPRETLAAIFRGSRVGLVTPLRDGMNLVAKEYVAAQDDDNPGVLILSQFAGAAAYMDEALIINPYDTEEMADAINKAVVMPLEERKERHSALLERVRDQDVTKWRRSFLADLRGVNA